MSSDTVAIDGCNFYRNDRMQTGGGVGLYIRSPVNAELINDFNIVDGIEFIAAKINIKSKSTL